MPLLVMGRIVVDVHVVSAHHSHMDKHNYPCGHPRTAENSKAHGTSYRCRTCRRLDDLASKARRKQRTPTPQTLKLIGERS